MRSCLALALSAASIPGVLCTAVSACRIVRRGTFTSVKDLVDAIKVFIDGWNERREPFVWTKTADQLIAHATRSHTTSIARH